MVRRARQEGEGALGWRLVVRTVRMMQSPVSTSLLIPAHGSEDTNLVRVDSDSALLRLRRRGDFIVNQLKQIILVRTAHTTAYFGIVLLAYVEVLNVFYIPQ